VAPVSKTRKKKKKGLEEVMNCRIWETRGGSRKGKTPSCIILSWEKKKKGGGGSEDKLFDKRKRGGREGGPGKKDLVLIPHDFQGEKGNLPDLRGDERGSPSYRVSSLERIIALVLVRQKKGKKGGRGRSSR